MDGGGPIFYDEADTAFFTSVCTGLKNVINAMDELGQKNTYIVSKDALDKLVNDHCYVHNHWRGAGWDVDVIRTSVMSPVKKIIETAKNGEANGSKKMKNINKYWSALVTGIGEHIGTPPSELQKTILSQNTSTQTSKLQSIASAGKRMISGGSEPSISSGLANAAVLGNVPSAAVGSQGQEFESLRSVAKAAIRKPSTIRKKPSLKRTDSSLSSFFKRNLNQPSAATPSSRRARSSTATSSSTPYPAIAEMPETFIAELDSAPNQGTYEAESPIGPHQIPPQPLHAGIQPRLWPRRDPVRAVALYSPASPGGGSGAFTPTGSDLTSSTSLASPTAPTAVDVASMAALSLKGSKKEKVSRTSTDGSTASNSTTGTKRSHKKKKRVIPKGDKSGTADDSKM